MPELRLHYTTVGAPSGEPVLLLHGTGGAGTNFLTPAFAGELFGEGQPLDAEKIFHHSAGRDRRGEIDQAVRRAARQVSALQLRRHGFGAVQAGDRGPGYQASAAGDRQFDGRHADLDVGRGVSGFHGRAGADGGAAHGDVEPQLDDAADADRFVRNDPEWKNGDYTTQPRAFRTANAFFRIATSGGSIAYQKRAPTREKADKLLNDALAAPFNADANDFLYQWESSRDYDAAPGLEKIEAALLAINSADDERNPPETGVMDARRSNA